MKTIKASLAALLFLLLITATADSQNSISIRLSSETGQDCNLASYIPDTPLPLYPDMVAAAWTYGNEFNLWRPLFRFNLNEIPSGSPVISARLSLYANPNPVSAPHSGANKSYIRKVTTAWDQNTVTWETQPDFSTVNQVSLSESISPSEDYLDLDVTELVRDMVANPSTNFGFIIMNRIENTYRSINFASSECTDINKRPKLDIVYGPVNIEPMSNSVPEGYRLYQNIPNPFNPETAISFNIPERTYVSLKIFDGLGREAAEIYSGELSEGRYTKYWNAANYPAGVYYYRIQTDKFSDTKKLVLVK